MKTYYRYSPEDENFVAARTLPGINAKGAFFTRGSGHNRLGGYTETPVEYQEVMDRLLKKHTAAKKFVPEPIILHNNGATFGIITMGGCDPACREAIDILSSEGIHANYMRIRGFPFGQESSNSSPSRSSATSSSKTGTGNYARFSFSNRGFPKRNCARSSCMEGSHFRRNRSWREFSIRNRKSK